MKQVEYLYDGANNRLRQIAYGATETVTTTYTNDTSGLSQVLVADDGTTQTVNIFGQDLLYQQKQDDLLYLLSDSLGSIRTEMLNETIQSTNTYEPYGKTLVTVGDNGSVYSFTGEEFDAISGLTYLRARYYSPYLKIFISHDPFSGYMRLPATQHGYSYVHNNPINLTDSTGMFVDIFLDATFILIDVGYIGYHTYKFLTTTGAEKNNHLVQMGVNSVALGIDLALAFIPFGTGGGMAYRFVYNGGRISVDLAQTLPRWVREWQLAGVAARGLGNLVCMSLPHAGAGGSSQNSSNMDGGDGNRPPSSGSSGNPKGKFRPDITDITVPGKEPKQIDWIPGHDNIAKAKREAKTDEYLESIGRHIDDNPLEGVQNAGRQGDRFVDGIKTEYKALSPGADSKRFQSRINDSLRGQPQARHIIVDACASGISQSEAQRGIFRSFGLKRAHKLDAVEVIGDGFYLIGTR